MKDRCLGNLMANTVSEGAEAGTMCGGGDKVEVEAELNIWQAASPQIIR